MEFYRTSFRTTIRIGRFVYKSKRNGFGRTVKRFIGIGDQHEFRTML